MFVLLNKNKDTLCSVYSAYSEISSLSTVKLISCTRFVLFRFDVPALQSTKTALLEEALHGRIGSRIGSFHDQNSEQPVT